MRCRNNTERPRYRAVASWREQVDVEAVARVLLQMAMHAAQGCSGGADQEPSTGAAESAGPVGGGDADGPQTAGGAV